MRLAAALILCLASTAAQAKPTKVSPPAPEFSGDRWVRVAQGGTTARDVTRAVRKPVAAGKWRGRHKVKPRPERYPAPGVVSPLQPIASAIIGGRPSGCPHRFCGCALSLHIFGRIIPTLNLAANWGTFPRSAPSSGMVAVRRGHVFKLLAHVGGNTWRVWDANSGRGRIRIHNRSIAGHAIVNPHGGRRA